MKYGKPYPLASPQHTQKGSEMKYLYFGIGIAFSGLAVIGYLIIPKQPTSTVLFHYEHKEGEPYLTPEEFKAMLPINPPLK